MGYAQRLHPSPVQEHREVSERISNLQTWINSKGGHTVVDGLWGAITRMELIDVFRNHKAPAATSGDIRQIALNLGCTERQLRAFAFVAPNKLGGKMLGIGGGTAIAAGQHFTAAGHAGQHGLHGVGNWFAQDLGGLVFQVGAVNKVLLNSLLNHGGMIPALSGIKRGLQPFNATVLQYHDIKPTGRGRRQAHQVMARRKNNAPLLERTDTGRRPAMAGALALAHFHENASAIRRAHDQVNFSAPAPRRPIIAHQQAQAVLLQIMQRSRFGGIARLLAGANLGLDLRENH